MPTITNNEVAGKTCKLKKENEMNCRKINSRREIWNDKIDGNNGEYATGNNIGRIQESLLIKFK